MHRDCPHRPRPSQQRKGGGVSFQISDKVVCVDDSAQGIEPIRDYDPIHKGIVYVVSDISEILGILGVQIVGAYAGTNPYTGKQHYWRASRFRKLSDVKAENAAKRKKKAKP